MVPIFAGFALWLCIAILTMAGVQLGSAAITLLLGLGAILIASSAVDTIKLNLSGFELKTKQGQSEAINFSNFGLPKLDYFSVICWSIIACTGLAGAYAMLTVDPPAAFDFALVISFLAFAAICIRSGLARRKKDTSSTK
jgi:hypothetical protein